MDKIENVISHFNIDGEFVDYREFGSGHINRTYIALFINPDGSRQKYIVQKINNSIFTDVDSLMNNIFSVTSYLRNIIKQNNGDADRETLHYLKTRDGDKYYVDEDGNYYRAYVFVKDSISYDSVDSPEIFKSSGVAFGRFQKMLKDFDADSLAETIPNFHNTKWRFENEFLPAVEKNLSGRKDTCLDEIEFVNARKKDTSVLVDLIAENKLPLRVTHNDTKLNNVMFDEHTNECVCVIDLDTVMPGLALYDFGDSIRFGASSAAEDETDLDKVYMDLDYYQAYAEGFLSEAGSAFNDCEIENLAFSAKLMTFECGMRFLTDYLNGDTYFRTDYPTHNLDRARNQFKLVYDMENKMDEMKNIISNIKF